VTSDPPSAAELLDRALRRTVAGAEARGLDPNDLMLHGPLVPAPEIFDDARKGHRRREVRYLRARKAEQKRLLQPERPPRISTLDGEAWLALRLRLLLPRVEKLQGLPWKGRGVAGPCGTCWQTVAQALQIHACAADVAQLLGLGPTKEGPPSTLKWARRQLEEWAAVEPETIQALGLGPLQQAVIGAAGSLSVFASASGFGGLARKRSKSGRPVDIPIAAFAAWLFAAGAMPMEIAAIAGALGIHPCNDREAGSRAMGRLKGHLVVGPGEVSPVRYLASLAIQRLDAFRRDSPAGPTLLPPLPFPRPGPAPELERRGEWVMVPTPTWALGLGFLNGLLSSEED
jgi:hypothetical protein